MVCHQKLDIYFRLNYILAGPFTSPDTIIPRTVPSLLIPQSLMSSAVATVGIWMVSCSWTGPWCRWTLLPRLGFLVIWTASLVM